MNKIDWNNKKQVLKAVKQDGSSLQFTSDELRNDKEVVLAAVQQDSNTLQYASDELKNDKDIVFIAVNLNGYALKYASDQLKNDKDIVLAAIKKDGYSLYYASDNLKNNFELLKLLKNYHMSKNINDYSEEYKTWYKERINVLDIFNEQLYLEKNIPNNTNKSIKRKL